MIGTLVETFGGRVRMTPVETSVAVVFVSIPTVTKGDLVRKLGLLIVEINIAQGSDFAAGQGTSHRPIFFDRIGAAAYYGFDISRDEIMGPAVRNRFLVLFEPPARLRFGLDVATQAARTARRNLTAIADRAAPRIRPDAPEVTAAALEAILQNAPASRRIEVVDVGGTLQANGCPYVAGQKAEHQPLLYLAELRRRRPADL